MDFKKYFTEKNENYLQITDAIFEGIEDVRTRQGTQKLATYIIKLNEGDPIRVHLNAMGVVFIPINNYSELSYSANLNLSAPFFQAYEKPPKVDKNKVKELENVLVGNKEIELSISSLSRSGKI